MPFDKAAVLAGALHLRLLLLLLVAACGQHPRLELAGPGGQPAAVQRIFLVTDRVMSPDPSYLGRRAPEMSRAVLDVGIPPTHVEGWVEYTPGNPDPSHSFALMQGTSLGSEAEFLQAVALAPYPDADVTVFVHGYNNTIGSVVYRHAQIAHDFEVRGPQVTFAWPSAANVLGYVQDRDSIDVARDDLEALLLALARGERRVLLVGHSMGSQLIAETLRQMSIGGEGWAIGRLSGVMLFSPDIDIDVFQAQAERIDPMPRPFLVFLSQRDRVLAVSARLAGRRERLGSTGDTALLQSLGVTVVDLTTLSGSGNDHLLAATSPTAISFLREIRQSDLFLGQGGPTVIDIAQVLVEGLVGPLQVPLGSQ